MKWTLSGLAIVLLAGAAYFFTQQKTSSNDSLEAIVPADTLYFFSATTTDELAQFMANYYIGGTPGGQAKLLHMGITATADSDSPAVLFVHELLNNYAQKYDGTISSLSRYLGTADTGKTVFYSHGIVPVLKLPLADAQQLNATIDAASAKSGLQYRTETIANKEIKLWALGTAAEPMHVSLALLMDKGYATITLLRDEDSNQQKQERLGLSKPKRSLADTNEIDQIQKQYGLTDTITGFLHIERLVAAVLEPEKSSMGREIEKLMGNFSPESDHQKPSAECVQEYLSIAKAVPRMILGYDRLEIQGDQVDMSSRMIVEIKNDSVTKELLRIRGHLSSHALSPDNKIFGLAYGVNLDELTPALTALWTDFTQKPFKCEQLVQLQEQAKQTNPMMLGMFLGMAQGIKGVAFSLYDIQFDESPIPSSLSALLSIAAENPAAVAGLTAMAPLPELAELQLPGDGTPVALPIPMMPLDIEVFAAIKGKHIVVYMGKEAETDANKLTGEALTPNGEWGMTFNYNKLAEIIQQVKMPQLPGLTGTLDGCVSQMEFVESMSQLTGTVNMGTDFTTQGWELSVSGVMGKPQFHSHPISGRYQTELMDESCQWQTSAIEEFTEDGRAVLHQKDFSDQCDIHTLSSQWSQNGATLNLEDKSEALRATCSDELITQTLHGTRLCFMSNVTETEFVCHFNPVSDNSSVVRYRKMP